MKEKRGFRFYSRIATIAIIIIGCVLICAVWTVGMSIPESQETITRLVNIYLGIVGICLFVGAVHEIKTKWLKM